MRSLYVAAIFPLSTSTTGVTTLAGTRKFMIASTKKKSYGNMITLASMLRGGTKKRRMGDLLKHNTLELNIEEKIDYNDLAELILDELTLVKLKEKALASDTNGQGKNSQDNGDPDDPYVRLKRDSIATMVAF